MSQSASRELEIWAASGGSPSWSRLNTFSNNRSYLCRSSLKGGCLRAWNVRNSPSRSSTWFFNESLVNTPIARVLFRRSSRAARSSDGATGRLLLAADVVPALCVEDAGADGVVVFDPLERDCCVDEAGAAAPGAVAPALAGFCPDRGALDCFAGALGRGGALSEDGAGAPLVGADAGAVGSEPSDGPLWELVDALWARSCVAEGGRFGPTIEQPQRAIVTTSPVPIKRMINPLIDGRQYRASNRSPVGGHQGAFVSKNQGPGAGTGSTRLGIGQLFVLGQIVRDLEPGGLGADENVVVRQPIRRSG